MMLQALLQEHKVILSSASPRRQQFFKELGIPYELRLKPVEEIAPEHLTGAGIAEYLAELKAEAQAPGLSDKELLVTADTIVWHRERMLPKPGDREEAIRMLQALSGEWHEVITAVCVSSVKDRMIGHRTTGVRFREISNTEIEYYVDEYQPYDKAGGYGIQEWIGLVAIEEIRGSYTNVVGLPTTLVCDMLIHMAS